MTFIHPLADIQGAGYSSFQSTIAVGSGQVLGKGVGYGTQSRLRFLPEYQTDFIFAAFAEEWGFVGALLYFALFAVVVWRVLYWSMRGATNFESIFGVGVRSATAHNLGIYHLDFANTGLMAAWWGANATHGTRENDAGAITQTTTRTPLIIPYIDGVGSSAGTKKRPGIYYNRALPGVLH
jgi:hypothetical protein